MELKARIHSVETMGTLDGPGIRFVIFMQGCPLRCCYCHNPDTWDIQGGRIVGIEELIAKILRYKPYMDASGGGVTVSGGEPTLQPEFIAELFRRCKEEGIHTALDTCGYCSITDIDKIIPYTDLVLFDIKHIQPQEHIILTGKDNNRILDALKHIDSKNIPLWIRHVILPGLTDNILFVNMLAEFLKTIHSLELVELLPYHNLGIHKWRKLGLKYPLERVLPPSEKNLNMIKDILNKKGIRVA